MRRRGRKVGYRYWFRNSRGILSSLFDVGKDFVTWIVDIPGPESHRMLITSN